VPRSVLTLRRAVPADAETLARTGWLARADTLLEHERGMPWALYGRSLLPPAAATRENRAVDAGVGSRP
jgi:hypothetical protein